mmetsp:Transcript_10541/g.26780  ORF Transcript_10541/g.26780 Transcript_10541/m.26780 type:complete len:391 (-) Transcript_10541:339-1511(-)|eukprot:jgi/Tetstr1/427215/TSEL_017403.t1
MMGAEAGAKPATRRVKRPLFLLAWASLLLLAWGLTQGSPLHVRKSVEWVEGAGAARVSTGSARRDSNHQWQLRPEAPESAVFFDTQHCCRHSGGPPDRRAFALVHDLHVPPDPLQLATLLRQLRRHHGSAPDVLFLVPEGMELVMPPDLDEMFRAHGVRVLGVAYPPLSASLLHWGAARKNCCSWREYLKLAVFGLDSYDAVVLLDSDQQVLGDLSEAFCCVADSRRVLFTSGPLSPWNGGFLALSPRRDVHAHMQEVLRHVVFSPADGYNGTGFGRTGWFRDDIGAAKARPARAHYGAEGPQGFLYYYHRLMSNDRPGATEAVELDRCIWNYQKEGLAKSARHPCRGYTRQPLLVHKLDSFARRLVQGAAADAPVGHRPGGAGSPPPPR